MLNWLCGELEVDKAELLSKRRFADLVGKRRVAACFFREFGKSFPQIGEMLNRDHSTVVHLVQTITDKELEQSEYLVRKWELINAE